MKGVRIVLTLGLMSGLLSNCVHVEPLTRSEVRNLTTCRNTNLENIRKSLVLSGYEIKHKSSTELLTEFKQVGGYDGFRSFRRISVVQEKPKVFRFSVRKKTIEIESEQPQQIVNPKPTDSTTAAPATVVNVTLGNQQRREFENEFDPSYDESTLSVHEAIRTEVCGQ